MDSRRDVWLPQIGGTFIYQDLIIASWLHPTDKPEFKISIELNGTQSIHEKIRKGNAHPLPKHRN